MFNNWSQFPSLGKKKDYEIAKFSVFHILNQLSDVHDIWYSYGRYSVRDHHHIINFLQPVTKKKSDTTCVVATFLGESST